MEAQLHADTDTDQGIGAAVSHVVPTEPPAQQDSDDAGFDLGARQAEELRVLLLGFGTGLTIAVVFLIYIVLETAGALP